jgi:hypothetical protein
MLKTLIYTVAVAILAVAGFNTFLIVTGQASPTTIVETVAVYAIILILAGAAFVKAVGSPAFHLPKWGKKKAEQDALDELSDKLDTLSDETDSFKDEFQETAEGIRERLDSLQEKVDEPPTPDAFVPTINTVDENGKLVKVYDLPPEDTIEEAIASARGSLLARDTEGNPVQNPRITTTPVFYS